ncbi:MAG TPA: hypothetical protein VH113_07925 [Gemmatimonadales bacterium]|jgi:hypothetical protein|nr:hypothetical protein [Gemmatimonadales bacterium]
MASSWQDSWTFRIVDQDTGAALSGVPVTVLDAANRSAGFWVSDADGVVQIPKHDGRRLRLRVGLRNEDTIELDARSLPDDPIPLAAPKGLSASEEIPESSERTAGGQTAPTPSSSPGQVIRYTRIGIAPEDAELITAPDESAARGIMRYGVIYELEQVWQSLGTEAGDVIHSVSVGPGDEARLAISDGRWRRKGATRERALHIVPRMVAAWAVGDGVDAAPLEPLVVTDVAASAGETVHFLASRTMRATESLRRRPISVTEGEEAPAPAVIRTVRNTRADGVLTYHVIEPVARYRVIERAPRARPALLVPFRLPNLATREVVRRFGHALRRALLDRALHGDLEQVLGSGAPDPAVEGRIFEHIATHLSYYSATIIAAGDAAERFFALAKLRDPEGRPLTDIIENGVVGRVGNYVAFPLRSVDHTTSSWRLALLEAAHERVRVFEEAQVTLPVPGVWLRAELSPAEMKREPEATEERDAGRRGTIERKRLGG